MTDRAIMLGIMGALICIMMHPAVGWYALAVVAVVGAMVEVHNDMNGGALGHDLAALVIGGSATCGLLRLIELVKEL